MTRATHRQAVAVLLVGLASVLCPWGAGRANPMPEDVLYAHVQPVGADFCAGLPITSCSQIVHSTPLMGELEFDLILDCWAGQPWAACENLDIPVSWPADWGFVGADVCGTDPGSFVLTDNGGMVHVTSIAGVPAGDHVFGLARVILDVGSPGRFEIAHGPGCTWYTCWARAGQPCGDCVPFSICVHSYSDVAYTDRDIIELEAETGLSASGLFSACNTTDEGLTFVASDPWMSLGVVVREPPNSLVYYDVTVTTNADLSGPGLYEGYVEVHAGRCHECVQVVLTLTDEDPPAAQPETWGSVKNRYREGSE